MEVRKEMFTKDDKIFIGYTKAELKEHDRLNILSQKQFSC